MVDANGKMGLGVRLFEEEQVAAERRGYRTTRNSSIVIVDDAVDYDYYESFLMDHYKQFILTFFPSESY